MMTLYIGPGVGIGSIIAVVGMGIAILFVLYAFIFLPIRKAIRKKKQEEEGLEIDPAMKDAGEHQRSPDA